MLVNTHLGNTLFRKCLKVQTQIPKANIYNRSRIGNRDWVCFGVRGSAHYVDIATIPFPAIRFRENTNELLALREKEKGDWRKLTIDEKKTLYRASFCQTFAEFEAPTGQWKYILGYGLMYVSVGLWLFILGKLCWDRPHGPTFSDEWRAATLRRKLDLKMEHLGGVSAHWDYEKDDWKS